MSEEKIASLDAFINIPNSSYKAHSSIIPNYASQVRPDTDTSPITATAQEPTSRNIEDEKTTDQEETKPAADHPITFPSTISLTLHDAGTLDTSYTHSTSTSSPQKPTFGRPYEDMPARGPPLPRSPDLSPHRRRGTLCRFLAGIRDLLRSKTQNTLSH
ncbi:MAG: hypothetical protein LQ348_004482 [Seirophora lacunosa]|nr:MAG: hypothetical protein LQ348_004482 [Seirophora lacunosa]